MDKDVLLFGALAIAGYLVYRVTQQTQQFANAASSIQSVTDPIGAALGQVGQFFGGKPNSVGGYYQGSGYPTVGGDAFDSNYQHSGYQAPGFY